MTLSETLSFGELKEHADFSWFSVSPEEGICKSLTQEIFVKYSSFWNSELFFWTCQQEKLPYYQFLNPLLTQSHIKPVSDDSTVECWNNVNRITQTW